MYSKNNHIIFVEQSADSESYGKTAAFLNAATEQYSDSLLSDEPILVYDENGLALKSAGQLLRCDFTRMLPRLKKNNLSSEMLIKAAKFKGLEQPLCAIDATAGFGEDSLLLAAHGFKVELYEYNPIIAAMLFDALERAKRISGLSGITTRMTLHHENSIGALKTLDYSPDIILLDPMFPERQKSALVKKKFQILHHFESPCTDEEAELLLKSAFEANPRKIIIKRPLKGPFLANIKPSYSLSGKAIRYDCIVINK